MKQHIRSHLVVLLLLSAVLAVITFPLVLHGSSAIPGFSSTDEPYAALWDSWRIRFSQSNGFSLKQTDLIVYPFGVDLFRWGGGLMFGSAVNHLFSWLFNPVVAWNTQLVINLLLSGFCAYLLVYYITGDPLSGTLSAMLFAFCPYQFARAWQHLGLTANQWIPLLLLSLFILKEKPSYRSAGLVVIAGVLLASFDYSVTYMGVISGISFLIYASCYNWRGKIKSKELLRTDGLYLRNVLILMAIIGIILIPQFTPLIKNRIALSGSTEASSFNAFHRPFEDLFEQSARPLSYFLPAVHHPVFGKITDSFVGSRLYGVSLTEHTVYLGWTGLVLAFFAFRFWRKRGDGDIRYRYFTGFFVFLALVAWLFSQPPWWEIGSVKIRFPSFFMYALLPMFRAYCRFGIILMLAVAVLAGLQWQRFLRRIRLPRTRVLLTACVISVALFEFWNWPAYKLIDVSRAPAAYAWIAQQADTVIAEYPFDTEAPNERYKFYQIFHHKKIINGALPQTAAHRAARELALLSDPVTVDALARRGVEYVVVHHKGYYETGRDDSLQELARIAGSERLRHVRRFPAESCARDMPLCPLEDAPIDVYEIIPPVVTGK